MSLMAGRRALALPPGPVHGTGADRAPNGDTGVRDEKFDIQVLRERPIAQNEDDVVAAQNFVHAETGPGCDSRSLAASARLVQTCPR